MFPETTRKIIAFGRLKFTINNMFGFVITHYLDYVKSEKLRNLGKH